MKVEFKKGDVVTFKPYEKAITAKVVEVLENGHLFSGEPHYHLTGVKESLLTYTTGRSILESQYYDNSEFSFSE